MSAGYLILGWRKKNLHRELGGHRKEGRPREVCAEGKAGASSHTPIGRIRREKRAGISAGEREDHEVALAGEDDAEVLVVGGDVKIADGEAVEELGEGRLGDRDFSAGGDGSELRNLRGDEVAGFFLWSALEEDAGFVGGPAISAEADANASEAGGSSDVADFEDFAVNKISDFPARWRNAETGFVTFERGEFLVHVVEHIQLLESGRARLSAILLDGDGEIHARDEGDVAESSALVDGRDCARREASEFKSGENLRLCDFGEVSDGVAVHEPLSRSGIENEVFALGDAEFVTGIVEEKSLKGVFGSAGVIGNGGGDEAREDKTATRGPLKRVNDVAESLRAARIFGAFEDAAALAAGFLNPDVVAAEFVLFCFEHAASGEDDTAVGGDGEGGDVFVDVMERFVEILGG